MSATRMDGIEIAEFLDAHATGVLSLARGDDGYAFPVAYTYEQADGAAYCRLAYGEDSAKPAYVEAADVVSLVVHDVVDGAHRSVVLRGPIEELSGDTLDATVTAADRGLELPSPRVADRPAGDVSFAVTRVDAREVTGVAERA